MTEIREGIVGEEMAALDSEIKCMEAELAEESATPLSWDGKTSTTAEELVLKEQHTAILLRFTSAAKITRLELRKIQTALHGNALVFRHGRFGSYDGSSTISG